MITGFSAHGNNPAFACRSYRLFTSDRCLHAVSWEVLPEQWFVPALPNLWPQFTNTINYIVCLPSHPACPQQGTVKYFPLYMGGFSASVYHFIQYGYTILPVYSFADQQPDGKHSRFV
jgi:hypothetical protein